MRNLDDVLMTLLVWICSPWRLARAFIFNHEFYNSRWHSNVFVSNVVVATIMIIALVCLIIYVGAGAGAPSEVDRLKVYLLIIRFCIIYDYFAFVSG